MRFLLDMNLSPDWVDEFKRRGISAIHWSQVGDIRASDTTIMQ
jgi:predicted nuclease of predicted toxin-antitoxin system